MHFLYTNDLSFKRKSLPLIIHLVFQNIDENVNISWFWKIKKFWKIALWKIILDIYAY